jgi:hypothetical protein
MKKMSDVKLFTMTEEQYQAILDASRPTTLMYLSGGQPMGSSPQENANSAWQSLGSELGFDWQSAKPANNGNPRQFYAKAEVRDAT